MAHTVDRIEAGESALVAALALDPSLAWAAARRALAGGAARLPAGDRAATTASSMTEAALAAAEAALARVGGRLVTLSDAEFPEALRRLPAGPVGLSVRGALPSGPTVGIVGARACTRAAAAVARDFAAAAAGAGFVVVSGGALGIDAAAHEGALAAGGATVAVLGSGLDRPYPERNRALFDDIAAHGAVVTPFPPGTPPLRSNFPRRNVLVAALSDRVVVVEARGRSGALITADAARGLGRPSGAVPGTPGCDRLLAAGARRLESAADLLAFVRGEAPRPTVIAAPTPEAAAVLAACDGVARGVIDLAARAGLDEEDARVALDLLELWGLVARTRSAQYVRIIQDPATPKER